MGAYESKNAWNVRINVNGCIDAIETGEVWKNFRIREVCDELSIFDWWNDTLSLTQLKAMRAFLNEAVKLGYTGYVCFKVGASGCASGMWAYRRESKDGYSPKGASIYRSFQSSGNYWDFCDEGGDWHAEDNGDYDHIRTARQLEAEMKAAM